MPLKQQPRAKHTLQRHVILFIKCNFILSLLSLCSGAIEKKNGREHYSTQLKTAMPTHEMEEADFVFGKEINPIYQASALLSLQSLFAFKCQHTDSMFICRSMKLTISAKLTYFRAHHYHFRYLCRVLASANFLFLKWGKHQVVKSPDRYFFF